MLPTILNKDMLNTKETWEKVRRPELIELFETWVYGVTPKEPLDHMGSDLIKTELLLEGTVRKETYYLRLKRNGEVCGFHYRVFSSVEEKKGEGRKKTKGVILMINPFSSTKELDYPGKDMDHMPYDLIIDCGYIGVHADVDELCLDHIDKYKRGLWKLYPQGGDTAWGAIGMWAFAASRLVDCLIMQKYVECGKIVICGCSRAGKAALWCGAQDERIGVVISNVSGCSGAAITRGKTGEHIKDITTQFPHWMCKNYASFADCEEELPVDQHMLLGLCAPRPLYISSASEDIWADPAMEFTAAYMAGEVYNLFGKEGLAGHIFPGVNQPVGDGCIRYHNRLGIHGCRRYDWEQYLPFIQKYI